LVEALRGFEGTLIFVSHDRWFVSRLATRIVEIKPGEVTDYLGTYEEYVHNSGDDHLDADTVILKARREKRARKKDPRPPQPAAAVEPVAAVDPVAAEKRLRDLQRRRDELTRTIETTEKAVADIDQRFCRDGFYDTTSPDEVTSLEEERGVLQARADRTMEEWAALEAEIDELAGVASNPR
jgi:ABC-type proline/glycine betaine transport system ATPase subunit